MNSAPQRAGRTIGRALRLRAPAKVNLHLEVLRRRRDGYHDIETIFQAVQLFDELRVELEEEGPGGKPEIDLRVSTGPWQVPADEQNLCWRAVSHFCHETGRSGRVAVELTKRIPPAAGLGGGSSDAAAVLVACDRLFRTGLEPVELEQLAAPLGADVPFFVRGGTALGRGTGTQLTRLPTIRTGRFLIVKPGLELSTTQVYATLKMGLTVNSPKANIQVIKPLLARFPQATWPGFNRLEDVVLPTQPALQRLILQLRDLAPIAMLSGSGAAAVAVFAEGVDLSGIVGEFRSSGLFAEVVGPHAGGVEIRDD